MNNNTQEKTLMFNLMSNVKKSITALSPMIDFPQEGEKIQVGAYAIRISAEPHSAVEISIKNGEWQPCRHAVGYWWFDWTPQNEGPFTLVARSSVMAEKWRKSKERNGKTVNLLSSLKAHQL